RPAKRRIAHLHAKADGQPRKEFLQLFCLPPSVVEKRGTRMRIPDAAVLGSRPPRPSRQDKAIEDQPPKGPRRLDNPRIAEELAEVRAQRPGRRGVGSAELDEQDGNVGSHGGTVAHFFLQPGPSLASFFSVIWASPPASLSGAHFSAFIC